MSLNAYVCRSKRAGGAASQENGPSAAEAAEQPSASPVSVEISYYLEGGSK